MLQCENCSFPKCGVYLGNFQHETYKLSNKELIYVGIWLLLKVPIQLSHIGNDDEWNNTSKHQ